MAFYCNLCREYDGASQHPQTGQVVYNLSLYMGAFMVFEDPLGQTGLKDCGERNANEN